MVLCGVVCCVVLCVVVCCCVVSLTKGMHFSQPKINIDILLLKEAFILFLIAGMTEKSSTPSRLAETFGY